jgi:hypothetical protein
MLYIIYVIPKRPFGISKTNMGDELIMWESFF